MMTIMMMMIMMMKMIIAVFAFLAINNFLGLKPKNELFICKNTTFLLNKFFSRMKLKF